MKPGRYGSFFSAAWAINVPAPQRVVPGGERVVPGGERVVPVPEPVDPGTESFRIRPEQLTWGPIIPSGGAPGGRRKEQPCENGRQLLHCAGFSHLAPASADALATAIGMGPAIRIGPAFGRGLTTITTTTTTVFITTLITAIIMVWRRITGATPAGIPAAGTPAGIIEAKRPGRTARLLPALAAALAACAISGCASGRTAEVRRLPVSVEPSSVVELPPPNVSWDQNVVKVSGVVRRKPGINEAVAGHIHVDFISMQGELLDQLLLPWTPQSIPIDGGRQSTYYANYGWQLPPNTKVRIAIADDEQEHAFPNPWASGGAGTGGTARNIPRGIGTPSMQGQPKTGMRRTPSGPKQRSSTPRTPSRGGGGGRR